VRIGEGIRIVVAGIDKDVVCGYRFRGLYYVGNRCLEKYTLMILYRASTPLQYSLSHNLLLCYGRVST